MGHYDTLQRCIPQIGEECARARSLLELVAVVKCWASPWERIRLRLSSDPVLLHWVVTQENFLKPRLLLVKRLAHEARERARGWREQQAVFSRLARMNVE